MNRIAIGFIAGILSLPAYALDVDDYQLVDLSHPYNNDTLYWPTSPSRFERKELAFGETDGGWFYSAFSICTPEHGGTHLDAPRHFAAEGHSTEMIPLNNLFAPAVVIDVSEKAAAERNFLLSADDVLSFEREYGRIDEGRDRIIAHRLEQILAGREILPGRRHARRCQPT